MLPAPTFIASPAAVPSVGAVLAPALPRVHRLQYAVGVMSRTSLPSPMSPPNAPVSAGFAHEVASIVGSAKIGRLGAVGQFNRFLSVTRRTGSADSYPTALACRLGSFVGRVRSVTVSGALSPVSPLRGPTPPSTGRAAIKPRRAGYVERWGAQNRGGSTL